MKTAIITDSAANLSKEFIKKHKNLHVIPLMILVDEVSHRDQVEISAEEVYNQLDSKQISTSLPSIEDLTNLLDDLKKQEYTDVLVINISSGLSGTFNAFRLVFEDYEGLNITHYDSKTLGGAQGYIVEYALELLKEKKKPSEIVPLLDTLRFEDSMAIYTIETLKYLRKGGRIGKVEGTIGDILKVKPVITVNDEGVYITLSKSFGIQRSLIAMKNLLTEKFGNDLIDLTIHYGNDSTKAEVLGKKLQNELNIRNLSLSALTPVLGIHTGPQMFAYIVRRIK
ncbi:DegV family protein [Liberiplasma polymorphum]|uniref:DegV family protein n=1 Tax=Liberiplasma polymorphum TaxID=3374570 RepID=UPI0037725619